MIPTPEQQIDALWTAMKNNNSNRRLDVFDWSEQGQGVQIDIDMYDDGRYVSTLHQLHANTREEAIAELIAWQTAERLT